MSDLDSSESPLDIVRERRELFERIASTDLPVAEDAQRGLSLLAEKTEEGDQ